jgi:hypothetical protein
VGVPGLQGADRGPRAHLGRACEPVGGANFSAPRSVILSFYSVVDGGPREVPKLEVWERPPSMLRNVDGGHREVPELEVRKLETSMEGPLGVLVARYGNGHHRN